MFFCHDKIYARVWKITPSEKYLDLQISTSEKKQDGEYINSSWFARCVGHAFNSLNGKLKEGDRITITTAKLSNERYTAKDGSIKSALRFVILEAGIEAPRDAGQSAQSSQSAAATQEASVANDDCPW